MKPRKQFETEEEALDYLRVKKQSFQVALRSPAGQNVLIDLAEFCRASETTFHKDARLHALLEGRREVFLRIVNFLNLTAEQIYLLSTGKQFNPREEDDNA